MKPYACLTLIPAFLLSVNISFAQNCTLSCPSNSIVPAAKGQEGTIVNFPNLRPPQGCGALTYTPASGSFFRLGSHSIILSSATGQKCSFTVTVTDNEAPELSPIRLSRDRLWPASNKMKKLGLNYTAKDNGVHVKIALQVSSNAKDGIKDWEIVDDHLLRLKASRLDDGSPRIFTIQITATDDAGNKTSRTTTIAVSNTITAVNLPGTHP